jgi:hypothetical protein
VLASFHLPSTGFGRDDVHARQTWVVARHDDLRQCSARYAPIVIAPKATASTRVIINLRSAESLYALSHDESRALLQDHLAGESQRGPDSPATPI